MYIMCIIMMFIIGAVFGSFFNVVGYRLPKEESIVSPPSHCSNCKKRLKWYELIPIVSYLIQGGKCRKCKVKIKAASPLYEAACGLLFVLAFVSFEFDPKIIIALTFISVLLIIMVSDYHYMIIPDEVLIVGGILIAGEIFVISGYQEMVTALGNGVLAFFTMWAIKKLGDFMFKKDSMGGGDIKLMFLFGLVLSYPISIISIFIASIIGLPVSLISMKKNKSHEIPFGPFLAIGAIVLLLFQIDFSTILNWYNI